MTDPALRDALDDLAVFVDAARPYLAQVVFVGGWVPYFYRYLPEIRVPPHDPILTRDFAYVHEVALLWSGYEPEVRTMVDSLAESATTWDGWVARGRAELARGFSSEVADGPVSVERELALARVSPAVTAGAAFRVVRPFLEMALGVRPLPKT